MMIMITGSRTWANQPLILRVLSGLPKDATIIHGGCRGADQIAGAVAQQLGLSVQVFPADWDKFGKKAGLIRNRDMAEICSKAFAFWDAESGGTAHAIQQVRMLGKTCDIFLPNGRLLAVFPP